MDAGARGCLSERGLEGQRPERLMKKLIYKTNPALSDQEVNHLFADSGTTTSRVLSETS
jgi:hypothetical protein